MGTLQPGPVIEVDRDDQGRDEDPAPEPTPEPPAREPGLVEWFPGGDVFIYDPDGAGGRFSCTWTVEHGRGRLAIETRTEPAGREARFSYEAVPRIPGLRTETIPGSSSGDRTMWKGTWSLTLEKPSDAWELESSECSDADDTTPSRAQGETAVVGMDPGDRVSCTYELKLLAPREGRWRSREPATRVSCGGVSYRIPAIRDVGTIRVRDDGMRLVARGLSSGDAVWRLDRQGEDSRRYAGTIRRNLGGVRSRFDLVLDLIDEERMEGTFEGRVRVRGQRCSVSKSITLRHAGN